MPRTESEMIAKLPVKVTLGATEYTIKPLTILKAREWRIKLNEVVGQLVIGDPQQDLTATLIAFPEKVAELVFAYAPELPKETIFEEATEEQLNLAFGKLMVVSYPFLASLQTTFQVTKSL
jgi:hypothetical protein